jgi:hypothetical protein
LSQGDDNWFIMVVGSKTAFADAEEAK